MVCLMLYLTMVYQVERLPLTVDARGGQHATDQYQEQKNGV